MLVEVSRSVREEAASDHMTPWPPPEKHPSPYVIDLEVPVVQTSSVMVDARSKIETFCVR